MTRLVLTREQCEGLFIPRIEPERVLRDEARVTVPDRPPIPVGVWVEVGWWRALDTVGGPSGRVKWMPVAHAIVAEVWGDAEVAEDGWVVTLTDIEATP